MRVTAAFPTSLVVGFLAGCFSITGAANADMVRVEPDDFAPLTVLTNAFPGVTLTVEGHPAIPVLARDGTLLGGPTAGDNIAPTGQLVFGHTLIGGTIPQEDFRIIWTTINPAPILRADFAVPADFVSIDARANDDDTFELQAFDASDNLLDSFNTGSFENDVRTMEITYTFRSGSFLVHWIFKRADQPECR